MSGGNVRQWYKPELSLENLSSILWEKEVFKKVQGRFECLESIFWQCLSAEKKIKIIIIFMKRVET